MLKLLILLTLTPLLLAQSCSASSANKSCDSDIGYGVCCQYEGNYSCFAGFDKCCGYDGICRSGYNCCPAIYGKNSLCLIGKYTCCNANKIDMYYCDQGTSCCEGGCCTYKYSWWLIAVMVLGGLVVLVSIGVCIYKKRRTRIHVGGGFYKDL